MFAPDVMSKRIAAWEKHYPWVDPAVQQYFRTRVVRARSDADEAIEYVLANATTRDVQERCIAAFVTKCDILWALLNSTEFILNH